MIFNKKFKKSEYRIDTSNCKCGSDKIQYEVYEIIREYGVREDAIQKEIISQELKSCCCPNCGHVFDFYETGVKE